MFEPPDLSGDYKDAITWVSQDTEVHKIISSDQPPWLVSIAAATTVVVIKQPNRIFSTSFIPPGMA